MRDGTHRLHAPSRRQPDLNPVLPRELAASLAARALSALDAASVGLFLVSIGTPDTGARFCDLTHFPANRLLADPGTEVYDALGLERGVAAAFLSPKAGAGRAGEGGGGRGAPHMVSSSARGPLPTQHPRLPPPRHPQTPLALGRRVAAGGGASLAAALGRWQPYLPPKPLGHALFQGGQFVFEGRTCVWAHADRATADHAGVNEILEAAVPAGVKG